MENMLRFFFFPLSKNHFVCHLLLFFFCFFFYYYYLKHPLFRNCWSLETNFRAYFEEFAAFRQLRPGYYMN